MADKKETNQTITLQREAGVVTQTIHNNYMPKFLIVFIIIVVVVVIIYGIYSHTYHKPKAFFLGESVSADLLKTIRNEEDIYPMFSDKLNKDRKFEGSCATQVLIENPNKQEVCLKRIIIELRI